LVATRPVDFRKGVDGLCALVQETLRSDPYSGVIYVFRAKRATMPDQMALRRRVKKHRLL
jgi:transposase